MSTLLALRYLKSLKCSSLVKNCEILSKCNLKLLPATQNLTTTASKSPPNPTNTNKDEWRIIFHMPLIRWASAFNSVKVPYGMVNGLLIPGAFALEQASQLPPHSAIIATSVGITSWCTLAICSFFVRNVVGIIYINDNNDKLKLAYVDYWGKRHDVCVELKDVIPDTGKSKQQSFYQSISLYSDNKINYKFMQRLGSIEDPETFASIFGE